MHPPIDESFLLHDIAGTQLLRSVIVYNEATRGSSPNGYMLVVLTKTDQQMEIAKYTLSYGEDQVQGASSPVGLNGTSSRKSIIRASSEVILQQYCRSGSRTVEMHVFVHTSFVLVFLCVQTCFHSLFLV